MAHKAKKSGGTKRRKKVGAMSLTANSPLVKFGSIAIGYLMGDTLNQKLIDKLFGTPTDPVKTGKMVAIGQIGLGGALVFLKLGKKSLVSEVAGGLLIGSGIKRAMVVFKEGATTMSGYGDVPVIGQYRTPGQLGRKVAGYGDVPVIGAYAPNSSLNGTNKVMGSMGGSTLIG
jgi:hypothetical protein